MARIPGVEALLQLARAQTEALATLPGAVSSLTSAVVGLAETVGQARDTLAALNRLAARAEVIVDELEEPLLALAPGLRRLAVALDDPVVEELPATLRQVQQDVLPVLRTLADTQQRVAFIAGQTERIMAFVDDTGRSLAGLPGAALLGRRRPAPRVVPGETAGPPR